MPISKRRKRKKMRPQAVIRIPLNERSPAARNVLEYEQKLLSWIEEGTVDEIIIRPREQAGLALCARLLAYLEIVTRAPRVKLIAEVRQEIQRDIAASPP